jgi:integrase
MLSPAPVTPEKRKVANDKRVEQHTHLARFTSGFAIPLTLLAQGTGTTTADTGPIHDAQAPVDFSALLMREKLLVSGATQRPIRLERKVLAADSASFPGQAHVRGRIARGGSLRVGEALGLQVQQVHLNDLDGGYLRIVGKGNKERVIPLIDASRSVALLRKILKTLGGIGPLFRGDVRKGGRHGEALDYSTIWYHFERYVERARSAHPERFVDEHEPITIHRLRHTYATIKLRDGISLPSVRKLLGHTNLQTTLGYTEIDLETIKRELVEARQRKR